MRVLLLLLLVEGSSRTRASVSATVLPAVVVEADGGVSADNPYQIQAVDGGFIVHME